MHAHFLRHTRTKCMHIFCVTHGPNACTFFASHTDQMHVHFSHGNDLVKFKSIEYFAAGAGSAAGHLAALLEVAKVHASNNPHIF
jgi:hypothetical protein